jgi:hypothetical protein
LDGSIHYQYPTCVRRRLPPHFRHRLGFVGLPVATRFIRSGTPWSLSTSMTGEVEPAALNPTQNVRSWQMLLKNSVESCHRW